MEEQNLKITHKTRPTVYLNWQYFGECEEVITEVTGYSQFGGEAPVHSINLIGFKEGALSALDYGVRVNGEEVTWFNNLDEAKLVYEFLTNREADKYELLELVTKPKNPIGVMYKYETPTTKSHGEYCYCDEC